MAAGYALYRYFDVGDRPLYVGKSGDLVVRDSAHVRHSDWMQFAARSTIERYGTPGELSAAERRAIEAEHPLFNRQFNDTPEARERLRAYLEEVGRPDLVPARWGAASDAERPDWGALASAAEGDLLALLRNILTADSSDHGEIRLRAVAALEGHADLPHGLELERLAALARAGRATAYRARKAALSAQRVRA